MAGFVGLCSELGRSGSEVHEEGRDPEAALV